MAETIGVFGGSFDPPHLGHVLVPPWALAGGHVTRMLVVPAYNHPFGKGSTPFLRRLALARIAFRDQQPRVQVSDLEARIAGDGPSYTIDLLEAVAGRNPDARVRLVLGSDILARGEHQRWHRWEDITARFDPVVVPRAGHAPPEVCSLPEVSSTEVRERVAAGDQAWLESRIPAAVRAALAHEPRGTVWLVGRGHVATHAGPWLAARGYDVRVLSARGLVEEPGSAPEEPPVGVWVLCADPHLPDVASALARCLPSEVPVLHAAGSIVASSDRGLAALARAGNPVGTLHPICSLRRERDVSDHLDRASFGLEGDLAAGDLARGFLDGQPFLDLSDLNEDGRVAYHAACALAANHLSVIREEAGRVLAALGHDREDATHALTVLMESSLDNLEALGVPAGVTGPASRGDAATVGRHLGALPDDAARVYELLSARLVALLRREQSS